MKKSSREVAKEGLRGAKPLVATNAQVPRDECSRWSRPMMRFVATNRMFRRDQFNVSSRPIKTNVATNQLTPRRGLFQATSWMETGKIAAPRSSAATGRMEKDGYKKSRRYSSAFRREESSARPQGRRGWRTLPAFFIPAARGHEKSRRRPTLARAGPALPSAMGRLTSVFGMGTGISAPLWPPA